MGQPSLRRVHQKRGQPYNTTARGYGAPHQAARRTWAPLVDAGNASCTEPVCLEPTRRISPGRPWDLAHDRDTGRYRGPAHRRCNRAEGARYKQHNTTTQGKQHHHDQPRWTSRTW